MSPRRHISSVDLVARYAPMLESVGQVIAAKRKALGLSVTELAARCEFSRSFVAEVEKGTRNPSFISLLRFAEALGCRPSELLADAGL